jgi:hypothetical protein
MVDFGNLTPSSIDAYEARLRRGLGLTDEMFLDGSTLTQPPLNATLMQQLTAELDTRLRRKTGRPAGDVSIRKTLAKALEDAAFPPLFHRALLHRLERGRRYTERDRAFDCHRLIERRKQKQVVPALYSEFHELYRRGEAMDHPIFGRIETGHVAGEPRQRAVAILAQDVARDLELYPPSVRRIINIVRKKLS